MILVYGFLLSLMLKYLRAFGNEGGNDLDEGETEKGEPQKGDYKVDPDDFPGLED